MRRFTRSKRRGGGIDPPTMGMTKDQLKSYITAYRQDMLSATEQQLLKKDLFKIAMKVYETSIANENTIAAKTAAALAAGPGIHVTIHGDPRKGLLHLLNLPSASSASASSYNNTKRRKSVKKNNSNALNLPSASASSHNNVNNLTNRFSKMSIHNYAPSK